MKFKAQAPAILGILFILHAIILLTKLSSYSVQAPLYSSFISLIAGGLLLYSQISTSVIVQKISSAFAAGRSLVGLVCGIPGTMAIMQMQYGGTIWLLKAPMIVNYLVWILFVLTIIHSTKTLRQYHNAALVGHIMAATFAAIIVTGIVLYSFLLRNMSGW